MATSPTYIKSIRNILKYLGDDCVKYQYCKTEIEMLKGIITEEELNKIYYVDNKGILVNDTLMLCTDYINNLQGYIAKEINNSYLHQEKTKAIELILHKDTRIVQRKEHNKYTNIKQKIKKPTYPKPSKEAKYKTDETDENLIYNCYGCYAIVNTTLEIIYIGETIRSFHQRWNEHYYKANHERNTTKIKKQLMNHPDTYCTIIHISEGDKEELLWLETETIEWYKDEYPDWIVLGG